MPWTAIVRRFVRDGARSWAIRGQNASDRDRKPHADGRSSADVSTTVAELRDAIRRAVGRHERVESTQFTKEALVAVCETLDADVDVRTTPRKAEMRAAIRRAVGRGDDGDALRKADLRAIARELGVETA